MFGGGRNVLGQVYGPLTEQELRELYKNPIRYVKKIKLSLKQTVQAHRIVRR
jgi:hypothetical protein